MKLRISGVTAALAAAALFGGTASLPAAAQQKFVTIGTGGVTGVYYAAGGAICRLVNKDRSKHGIRCSVESTGGSVFNVNTIKAGELDFGFAQSDVQFNAIKGQGQYKDSGAYPDMRTAFQVARGLAGFLLVVDPEQEAGLPDGVRDLPLLIQDRSLDIGNANSYAAQMMGFLGDEVAVNGLAGGSITVAPGAHRLRLLNSSVTRTYKLAWSDARPLRAVATDAGLLPAPLDRPYLMLAPGERRDVVVDFGDLPPDGELSLRSLDWDTSGMGGAGRPTRIPEGSPFVVARFRAQGGGRRLYLPAALRGTTLLPGRPSPRVYARPPEPARAAAVTPDRRFVLDHRMMQWTINGRSFEMEAVAPDEVLRLGAAEVWEWDNSVSAMMMVPHAMHVHLVRFKVLERSIAPRQAAAYATVSEGLLDEGWKDTVLVMPGERVKVGLRFEPYAGLFLYHCHMLDHEDMGMMRNFRVEGA